MENQTSPQPQFSTLIQKGRFRSSSTYTNLLKYSKPTPSEKMKEYQKDVQIGRGGFARVFLGSRLSDKRSVCLKYISCKSPEFEKDLEGEAICLKELCHENIVSYIDHFRHKNDFVIVIEHVKGTTLQEKIKNAQEQKEKFSESFIWKFLKQTVSALNYCHHHQYHIIHQDIKPDNILISDVGEFKLIDFGISKQLEFTLQSIESEAGTYIYMSPEIINNQKHNISTDIWSLGIVLFELMALDHPFSYEKFQYMNLLKNKFFPNFEVLQYSNELITFVKRMLNYDQSLRISSEELNSELSLIRFDE
jgi:NIMA (never in mitosis gene a)-related kinase